MNRRLIKTAFLALAAAAAFLVPSSRADDTTPAPANPNNTKSAKLKFYGPITAVDTNKMTFTVDDQTYTITTDSDMTKNGKTATLGDAVVGEPARGSYTKSADGKLDVTKVRFGKKSGGKAGGKHKKSGSSGTDASAPATPAPGSDTNSPPASPQQ